MKTTEIYEHILAINDYIDPEIRPYQATLNHDGRTLTIFGVEHTDTPEHPQLTIVRSALEEIDASASTIAREGGVHGPTWEPLFENARQRGIETISIEPLYGDIVTLALEKNVPGIDIASWGLLNTIMQPNINHMPKVIEELRKQFSLPDNAYTVLREHIIKVTGNESLLPEEKDQFDTVNKTSAREAQRPQKMGTSIQRAGEALNRARDTLMVVRIIELSATHNIIAIMGLNHAVCQIPAFHALGFSG